MDGWTWWQWNEKMACKVTKAMNTRRQANAKHGAGKATNSYTGANLSSLAFRIASRVLIRKSGSFEPLTGPTGDEGIGPVVICKFLSIIAKAFAIFPDFVVDCWGTALCNGGGAEPAIICGFLPIMIVVFPVSITGWWETVLCGGQGSEEFDTRGFVLTEAGIFVANPFSYAFRRAGGWGEWPAQACEFITWSLLTGPELDNRGFMLTEVDVSVAVPFSYAFGRAGDWREWPTQACEFIMWSLLTEPFQPAKLDEAGSQWADCASKKYGYMTHMW
jgi:hypothetical protein